MANYEAFDTASAVERAQLRRLAEILGVEQVDCPTTYPYDCVWSREGTTSVVEAKCRTFQHDRYDGAMIEKDKFDNLIRLSRDAEKCLYVNFYADGYVLIWNLNNVEGLEWRQQNLIYQTMDKTKGNKMKTVAFLKIKDAVKIKMQ
jgi:hypothetical protein